MRDDLVRRHSGDASLRLKRGQVLLHRGHCSREDRPEALGGWWRGIEQIRERVQASELPTDRKDRLFALLSQLLLEVNRERTPVYAAGDLFMTLCAFGGEGGRKLLTPITLYIERIYAAIGASRGHSPPALPTPPKRIEDKRPQPSKGGGSSFEKALDEEIPF